MGGSSSSSSNVHHRTTSSQQSLGGDNTGLMLSNVSGSTIAVSDYESIKLGMGLAQQSIIQNAENVQALAETTAEITGQYFSASEMNTDAILGIASSSGDNMRELAGDSLNTVERVSSSALSSVVDNSSNFLSFVDDALSRSAEAAEDLRVLAFDAISGNLEQSLNFAEDSRAPAGASSANSIAKYAVVAAGIIGVFAIAGRK